MFHSERDKIVREAEHCRALLNETNSVLHTIISLEKIHQFIHPRTIHLHDQCHSLMQEMNDLQECHDKIKQRLTKQEEVRSIIKRIPSIKFQILTVLNTVCQSYQNNQKEQEQQPLDEYYGRFYIECRRIRELTGQLISCLPNSTSDELLLNLEEIYTVYLEIREQLMGHILSKNLGNLVSKAGRNYCDLLRQTSNCLVRMIRNEIQLFNQIFPSHETDGEPSSCPRFRTDQENMLEPGKIASIKTKEVTDDLLKRQTMNRFLEVLCTIFYENLRSVVIHVNHLETLAEMYKLVTETIREELHEGFYQSTMDSLAGDIQERMTYRVEVFIQECILDYKPSSGDLAYPEKLEIVSGGEFKDFQSMWYPTVQRTVLALFYMNRVFDPSTFEDLAQEVVLASLRSLDTAQRLIDERHSGTKMEAMLFLTKHLAILRDQLTDYYIPQSTRLFSEIFPNLGDDFRSGC